VAQDDGGFPRPEAPGEFVDGVVAECVVALEVETERQGSAAAAVSFCARNGARAYGRTVKEWERFLWAVYRQHLGVPRRMRAADLANRAGCTGEPRRRGAA